MRNWVRVACKESYQRYRMLADQIPYVRGIFARCPALTKPSLNSAIAARLPERPVAEGLRRAIPERSEIRIVIVNQKRAIALR
jgi:hypothetical protein